MTLRPQQRSHPPRAEEWPTGEQLIDPPHQCKVVVGGRQRRLDAGACNAEQLALPADRKLRIRAINEPAAVRGAHLPDLLAKNPVLQ